MERLTELISSKEVVIWDFDGTLVSLEIDWSDYKKELSSKMLIREVNREELFTLVSKYESTAAYSYDKHLLDFIRDHDGKAKFAIFSDNLKTTITGILSELGIVDKFSHVVGKEDVSTFKPSAEGLHILDHKLGGVLRKSSVFIGNSWKDEVAAKEFGIDFLDIGLLL